MPSEQMYTAGGRRKVGEKTFLGSREPIKSYNTLF